MTEITPVHQFVDPGLNYLFTKNYNLSIRILPDGFSYTVFDTLKEKFVAIEEFGRKHKSQQINSFGSADYIHWLSQILNQAYLLKEKFNKVSILTGGGKHTLVPVPLFDSALARKQLGFNHALMSNDIISYDLMKAPELCLIFAVPGLLSSWTGSNFPDARMFHVCGSLIRNFHLQFMGGSPITRILANIQTKIFDLIIFKGSSFQYCNSFHYSSHTDLLYYLLFVIEQLKINPEVSPLFLSGMVENNSEITKLLSAYIRYVELIPETQDRKFGPSFDHAPFHRYYELLNASLCG